MLRIGKKDREIQVKAILEEGWADITSISMWIGMVKKYNFDKIEAEKQIELFKNSLGANIDECNQAWYDYYKSYGIHETT